MKTPNRNRMIRTMKLLLVVLKADGNMRRYADEILRFLIHQICILSAQEARFMFYSMFVNNKGKMNSFIPCELMMEFIVRNAKKHIKHMCSNKTDSNINRKTGALAGLDMLIKGYDTETDVRQRSGRHIRPTEEGDVLTIAEDLRSLSPFTHQPGRHGQHFTNISPSLFSLLDFDHFLKWLIGRGKIH